MQGSEQPEQLALPTTPASLSLPTLGSGNALITGQVCRYVASFPATMQPPEVDPFENLLTIAKVIAERAEPITPD
jgi:hypothetical protein